MKLGLNTWLWAYRFETRHLFCIEQAQELGAEVLDFSVADPFQFPTKEVAQAMAHTSMDAVVTTAMSGRYNAISPDPAERKAALDFMKRLIDIAAELNAPLVGGVTYAASGYHTGHPRTQQEIAWCTEYLHAACQYAAPYHVTIALEPVKRFETHFLNTAAQALDLIELVHMPNLKVHLDTFHMNIEESSIPNAVRLCGDKLAYLHLVENNRGTPGMGHIPWIELFTTLKESNFQGAGCIETFNPETLDETAPLTYLTRKFADTPQELAEQGLKYLKTIRTLVETTPTGF